jgi:serine/threonine protein kinase
MEPHPVAVSTDGSLADTLAQDGAALARALELSTTVETPPSTAPGYQIVRRLGAGKFGSVWLAREQNTGKHVAIKFYSHRRGVDWSLLSREVEKLAVLYTSRNIVRLLAVGWDHDPPYYVMEYLASGSLAQRLDQGPLAVTEAVQVATRVSLALVHAHGSGILHCDLKPANVLLDQDGEPRLCDFGQSRLADERSPSLGTLFYMAPEQADLKAVPDARWDVYALGALLYHMLCGQPPHRTDAHEQALQQAGSLEDRLQLYRQIVSSGARPMAHRRVSGVDGPLADIVDRCLALDPARRFANAQAVLDKLIARERQRARRPLLFMGLVLPLLLVLSLLPFAWDALQDAVTTSRSNLVQRALESDVLSANLLSDGIQRELEHRLNELEAIADDADVRAAILELATEPMERRGPLYAELNGAVRQIERRHARPTEGLAQAPPPDQRASWFLQDAGGVQRWRLPESNTVDQWFGYRDYFHGHGGDYPSNHPAAEITPIQHPSISRPYRSTTERDRYKVALSVPVFDQADEPAMGSRRVIGVLARTLYLSQLLEDYERALMAQGNAEGRRLALIDRRTWSLLAHHWMTDAHLREIENPVTQLRIDETLSGQLGQGATDRVDDYRDPVSRFAPQEYDGAWLAAFSGIGDTGWIAVVQEPSAPVLRPVDQLKERLVWTGIGSIALVLVLVAGGWWLILLRLNDSRPRWWPRRWLRRPPTLGTTLTAKASESA